MWIPQVKRVLLMNSMIKVRNHALSAILNSLIAQDATKLIAWYVLITSSTQQLSIMTMKKSKCAHSRYVHLEKDPLWALAQCVTTALYLIAHHATLTVTTKNNVCIAIIDTNYNLTTHAMPSFLTQLMITMWWLLHIYKVRVDHLTLYLMGQ
jgi:hypothetical protein